jgi:hypothetical protein
MQTVFKIFFYFIFSLSTFAQIPKDKQYHLYAGAAIGAWGTMTTNNEYLKPIYGIGWATMAGAGKELIYDKYMKLGIAEWKDFSYTLIGSCISVGIISAIKGIIKNHKNKKYHILI